MALLLRKQTLQRFRDTERWCHRLPLEKRFDKLPFCATNASQYRVSAAQLRCCGLRGESRSLQLRTAKQIKCRDLTGSFKSSQFYLFSLKGLCNLHRILSTGNYEPVSLNSRRSMQWSRRATGTGARWIREECGETCLLHMLLLHGAALAGLFQALVIFCHINVGKRGYVDRERTLHIETLGLF